MILTTELKAEKHILDTKTKVLRLMLWLGLFVGATMLLAFPLDKPVWDDELDTIMQGSKSYWTIFMGASDTQPPLHFLVIRLCQTFGGDNLAVYRLISSIPPVVSLWYVYQLGKRLSFPVAVVAVWLTALSPALILFDRMARYHGLLAMLSTLSMYYWLAALEQGRRRNLIAYGVSTFFMLTTYYLSIFVLVAQIAMILPEWRRYLSLKPVLIAMALSVAAFLPWLIHGLLLAHHDINTFHVEDPRMSLGIQGFIRRIGLPLYSFCLGETVYPWRWPVSVTGCVSVFAAFWLGAKSFRHRPEMGLVLVVLTVVVLSALLTSGAIGSSQTVGSMSKRVSFVLPLFYVIVSAGVLSLRNKWLRAVSVCLILGTAIYAVSNYWTNRQFLNPNYIAPWEEAISQMKGKHWGYDTMVITCADPALHYYIAKESIPMMEANVASPRDVSLALNFYQPQYVWLVGRDRGDQSAVASTAILNRYFQAHAIPEGHFDLMPRGPEEQYWFAHVLHRHAAPNYLWGDLFNIRKK